MPSEYFGSAYRTALNSSTDRKLATGRLFAFFLVPFIARQFGLFLVKRSVALLKTA